MGRKNRNRHHHQEHREHHHEHQDHHHHHHGHGGGEIESTGEPQSSGESHGACPPYISPTGRHLADYPVETAHETPDDREERRLETIDEQLDKLSLEPHDEDVQIDRYRAQHLTPTRAGKPHEMIDDEITTTVADFHTEKTPAGGVVVNPLAHTKAGFKQGNQARHAAFKRILGLPDDALTVSPVSGGQKK